MESKEFLGLVLALLLFTSFVKTTTVLTICRYGLGLVGFEFGAVCLIVSLVLSLVASPPELTNIGFPEALFSRQGVPSPQAVSDALMPFMKKKVDPEIERALFSGRQGAAAVANGESASVSGMELRDLAPAFVLSELKQGFQVGCMLLVPLVAIDLLSAHLLALLGIQHMAAQVVALPLKILVFIASGGWGLLGKKLLGLE